MALSHWSEEGAAWLRYHLLLQISIHFSSTVITNLPSPSACSSKLPRMSLASITSNFFSHCLSFYDDGCFRLFHCSGIVYSMASLVLSGSFDVWACVCACPRQYYFQRMKTFPLTDCITVVATALTTQAAFTMQ